MSTDNDFMSFFLEEATDILVGWEKACLQFEQTQSKEAAESLYRGAHNMKSGSAAVGLTDLSALVHRVEDLISKILSGKIGSSPELIRLFLEVHTTFSTWIAHLRDSKVYDHTNAKVKIEQAIAELTSSTPPTPAENPAEKTVAVAAAPAAVVSPSEKAPAAKVNETPAPQQPEHGANAHQRGHESIRVAASKLDMLIQLVGEICTQQAIIWHGRQSGTLESKSCDNAIQLIQRSTKDLQSLALSLRMQPLQSLFQRLQRAASDLARSLGKKIDVVMQGEHVELDRAVIERITEALMHIIRNAIDHGVEDPQGRSDAGKAAVATVKLEGAQEPGGILITISDDGKGLNTERILKKALEKGLANPDQKYTTAEIQRFIFAHGFSTAEKVTDISGRGVGMDVVKNAVQAIGGDITVSSVTGQGTVFAISLPATLSIIDALIVYADGTRYGVPVQDVTEIVDLADLKLEASASHGRLLTLRQAIVPLQHLQNHLPAHHAPSENDSRKFSSSSQKSSQPALIVRSRSEILAFQVDYIADQQPVSMRPLPGGLDSVPGYTGGAILGDGDPCIILNLPGLVRLHAEKIGGAKESSSDNAAADVGRFSSLSNNDTAPGLPHLIFHVGGHLLATPLLSIREILQNTPCNPMLGAATHVIGCIDLRGQILPVIDLGTLLKLAPSRQAGPMIVIELAQSTAAFTVDKIEAVDDLVHITGSNASGQEDGIVSMARFRNQVIPIIDMQNATSNSQHLMATLAAMTKESTKKHMEAI